MHFNLQPVQKLTRMKPLKYFIFLVPLLIAVSCKKKTYPESSTETEALFSARFTVDNLPVSLAAGKDGYYLYASNEQSAYNVYSFISDFRKVDCNNCTNRLEIRINDATVTPQGSSTQIDQAVYPHAYSYVSDTLYTVQFQSSFNKSLASLQWDFGDGTTNSTDPILSHTYTQKGKYNVSLSATSNGGCISSVTYPQNVGVKNSSSSALIVSPGATNVFSFVVSSQGFISQCNWDFGDGSILTTTTAAASHSYNIAGGYPVSVIVKHSGNDSSVVKYNLVTQTDNSSCAANYRVTSISEIVNTLKLGGVTVNWTDASGVKYTSDNVFQPKDSFFEVLSVSDSEDNEKGEKTKSVHIRFKCRVFNGVQSKLIDNAEAVICVSYK